jgi:hypothetical protein
VKNIDFSSWSSLRMLWCHMYIQNSTTESKSSISKLLKFVQQWKGYMRVIDRHPLAFLWDQTILSNISRFIIDSKYCTWLRKWFTLVAPFSFHTFDKSAQTEICTQDSPGLRFAIMILRKPLDGDFDSRVWHE